MFRNLNHVPMGVQSEDIAKSIFSNPFGGHLGFMQIRWSSTPWIQLDFSLADPAVHVGGVRECKIKC